MDCEKLKRMQSAVRTGGRGTARRKKAAHKGGQINEKRLQDIHKKNGAALVAGAYEVKIFVGDTILHIMNATVKHSQSANYYVVIGCTHAEKATGCPNSNKRDDPAPARSTFMHAPALHCSSKKRH